MFEFTGRHEFFVGIDSDGCVFDTMELKHKECFIPHIIEYYGLQGISKYAREVAEFVNLYSKSRGINRFPALIETLRWLEVRPEVQARGVRIEIPQSLAAWIAGETRLANTALAAAAEATGDRSCACAGLVADGQRHHRPRGGATCRRFLSCARRWPSWPSGPTCSWFRPRPTRCSTANGWSTIWHSTWRRSAGRSSAPKKSCSPWRASTPRTARSMIGDALGDYLAAQANDALFYPINPGAEETSWKRLHDDGIDRFLSGRFAGDYQQSLVAEFHGYLPEQPPWLARA